MASSEINIQIDTGGTAAQTAAEAAAQRAISAAGHAPAIGENGHWQLWDANAGAYVDTGVSAQGGTGETGIESASINAAGHLIFIMTDGATLDAGSVGTAVSVDETITENGNNPVSGGAIYDALTGKADSEHTHDESDVTGLVDDLAGKADAGHTHAESEITGLADDLTEKADAAHTHSETEITGLTGDLAGKADVAHTHVETEITGLMGDLAGKADATHTHAESDVTGLSDDLAGKAAATHTHAESDVTGLTDDLAGKAAVTHTHPESEVTGLADSLAQKADASTVEVQSSINGVRVNHPSSRGFEKYDGAVLTFFDDDGTVRFLNEHVPVYRAHGVFASFAVVACRAITPVGITTSGDPYEAVTFEQIRSLVREGFEAQNHTWSHSRNIFNIYETYKPTDEEIDEEYRRADKALRENGLDYDCMVFPFGAHWPRHLEIAKRYARFGVNCRGTNGLNYGSEDPMDYNRLGATANGGNLSNLKSMIDRAISENAWLIIMTHAGASQPDATSLDELVTYAVNSGIRIETFSDAARLKAPSYYSAGGAFSVSASGVATATLTDDSIRALIARAYQLGAISASANAVTGLTAVWNGGELLEGDTLHLSEIGVTLAYADGTTAETTDFTVDGNHVMKAGTNTFTVRYGTVSGTFTLIEGVAGNSTLLCETTTVYSASYERDRAWFGKHLEAGTYDFRIALTEAPGVSSSANDALILKTAGYYGDTDGASLCRVSLAAAQEQTEFTGSFTLTEATDGFYLYARLLKAGVTIRVYLDAAATDSTAMDFVSLAEISASSASPGATWVGIALNAGTHFVRLTVTGLSGTAKNALTLRNANAYGDTTGTTLAAFDGGQIAANAAKECELTLTDAVNWLYFTFEPGTVSTFAASLAIAPTERRVAVIAQPEDKVLSQTQISGSLNCLAVSSDGSAVAYQWYRNTAANTSGGTAIDNATTGSLTIPTDLPEGVSYYYCAVVSASAGEAVSRVSTVTITSDTITISEQPENVTGNLGELSGTLSCVATASDGSAVSYQWYKSASSASENGTLIAGATDASYTLPAELTSGTHYYYCVASSPTAGTLATNTAMVTVVPPALLVSVAPTDISAVLNETATFTATATGGVSPYTYQWQWRRFASSAWANSSTGATNAVFTVTVAGDRLYQCVVTDSAGQVATSNQAALTATQPPGVSFTLQPVSVRVAPGEITGALSCAATATDGLAVSYQWYQSDTGVNTNGTLLTGETGASLTIPTDLALGDYSYYCAASSATAGEAVSSVATVSVMARSYIAKYSLTGEANAAAPASIADESGQNNTALTVTGVTSYSADGTLPLTAAGQLLYLSSVQNLPSAYRLHIAWRKDATASHRIFVVPAHDLNAMMATLSSTTQFIKLESASEDKGFTPAATINGLNLCGVDGLGSGATEVTYPYYATLDIDVSGDILTSRLDIVMNGVTYAGEERAQTVVGFTAALAQGIYIGNRAAGDRFISGAVTEFFVEEI